MKKALVKIIWIFIILILLMQNSIIYALTEKEELQQEQSKINNQLKEMEKKQDELEKQKSKAMKTVENLIDQVAKSEEEIGKLKNQISNLEEQITSKKDDIEHKEEEYNEQEKLLDKRLIAIYKNGIQLTRPSQSHQSMFGEKIDEFLSYHDLKMFDDEGHYLLTIDRKGMGWTENVPFKMYVGLMHKQYYAIMPGVRDYVWKDDYETAGGLGKGCYKAREFGWLIP